MHPLRFWSLFFALCAASTVLFGSAAFAGGPAPDLAQASGYGQDLSAAESVTAGVMIADDLVARDIALREMLARERSIGHILVDRSGFHSGRRPVVRIGQPYFAERRVCRLHTRREAADRKSQRWHRRKHK